ncbi:MAG TPA: hypothetical protein VJH03_14140 [Blastocatellia bacterium]|nr:hypothetical protein [Blastocatellia bacterium]
MFSGLIGDGPADIRVVAGEKLVLRVHAYDPAGIHRVVVKCFQFSLAASSKIKIAIGETDIPSGETCSKEAIDVEVNFPASAALGKWGVQTIEFTNGRGYKTSFYRGQGKFDQVVFEVIPPPSQEDQLLRFDGVEVGTSEPM